MPRKKTVTTDILHELINKAKRVKKLQVGRFEVGNRSDGQPIYHYPRITKVLLAKKLGVSANYLTILQKKDEEIGSTLAHVGQPRGLAESIHSEEPRKNTKAGLEYKIKIQSEKIKKLEQKVKNFRERNLAIKVSEKQIEDLLAKHDELLLKLAEQRKEITRLKSMENGFKMENASLRTQIVLKSKNPK